MFIRELKINLKSFIIWTMSLTLLCLLVFMLYDSVIKGDNLEKINEAMESFPPDVLKMFNLDISNIDSTYGWLKTEGIAFVYIVSGMYSAVIGSNLLLKEEDEKTVEYLFSLPITPKQIVLKKFIVGIIYITGMIVFLTLFNFIGLNLSEEYNKGEFFSISLTTLLPCYVIYALCMFISTFTHKSKKVFSLSIGFVFGSYFLYAVAQMNEKIEFLRYFSVFSLCDTRNIITNGSFSIVAIIVFALLFNISTFGVFYRYQTKEMV